MTNLKQIFEITVWYRYISYGEQEKDFDTHNIEAESIQEAVNKAANLYNSHKCIPCSYSHNGENYKPTNFNKETLFNLTSPTI